MAKALLAEPIMPLPPPKMFVGAGVYVIYYNGDFPAYRPIAEKNRDDHWASPIYVGKAVPAGARKGGYGLGKKPGTVLYRRLCEHAKSIRQVQNLDLRDFRSRHLVVEDIWIPLGESLLITMFSPLWNQQIEGFGIHDPGTRRATQQRSSWDTIHPGRPMAAKLQRNPRTANQILREVEQFLQNLDNRPSTDILPLLPRDL